ncbi:MAG: GntR family transcriptional regulator [Corynebacterium glucuronolyticum]|nr:GntR family transcriptional regulator [Corynebacterium glucuronolyticum]
MNDLSKSEQVYRHLREQIRTRELDAGDRIVLSTVADELGMSVVPVREAVRQLEAEGYITYETNVGARVTRMNRDAYFETIESLAVIEAAATGLAAPHMTAADLAEARSVNDQMRKLLEDFKPEVFTDLNMTFHGILTAKCPNKRLIQLVRSEWERLDYFRVSTFRYIPKRAESSVEEHARIVNLIEAGAEPGYIESVARQHRLTTSDTYRLLVKSEK